MIEKFLKLKGPQTGIAFFYCDYRDSEHHTTRNIIASMIKQLALCRGTLPEALRRLYNACDGGQKAPQEEDLQRVLLEVCETFPKVFLVIDALDECNAITQRPSLLRALRTLRSSGTRLFITSRPSADDITGAFSESTQIAIKAQKTEIQRYLQARIENSPAAQDIMDRELQADIIRTLSRDANEMCVP